VVPAVSLATVAVGRGVVKRQGKRIAVLVFGTLLAATLKAADSLDLTVADMRFVKPIDRDLILDFAARHEGLVTVEEGSIMGGAGSAVSEVLAAAGIVCPILHLGLPDRFIDHGDQAGLLAEVGLSAEGISASIVERFFA